MNRKDFDALLQTIRMSLKATKEQVRQAAEAGLSHFYEHGNTAYCQDLLAIIDNEGKNFIRRAAYLTWLKVHAPITMNDKGTLVKDKSETAVVVTDALKAAAMAKPFWEFAPEKEAVYWGGSDLVTELSKVTKKFSGAKHLPKDVNATALLAAANEKIAELGRIAETAVAPVMATDANDNEPQVAVG